MSEQLAGWRWIYVHHWQQNKINNLFKQQSARLPVYDLTMSLNFAIEFKHQSSSPPSIAYMLQWTESALVQARVCRLFGAKPLPEPMLTYCEMDSLEQISVLRPDALLLKWFSCECHRTHLMRSQHCFRYRADAIREQANQSGHYHLLWYIYIYILTETSILQLLITEYHFAI